MSEIRSFSDTLDNLIGDVPVSEQLGAALERMAAKDHTHDDYATRDEVVDLKRKIEMLIELVGDKPVAYQIIEAINHMK
jgi:hypothetical protein